MDGRRLQRSLELGIYSVWVSLLLCIGCDFASGSGQRPRYFGVVLRGVRGLFTFTGRGRSGRTDEVSREPPGIVEFVRTRFGFEPDARQAEVLEAEAKQGILNCSRQWGKSTVTAAKALYRACTRPGCLVLVASPTERQSAEWMRNVRGMARRLADKGKPCGVSI